VTNYRKGARNVLIWRPRAPARHGWAWRGDLGPTRLPFLLPCRLARNFGSIVEVTVLAVLHAAQNLFTRRSF
jgi:hypothetical protein